MKMIRSALGLLCCLSVAGAALAGDAADPCDAAAAHPSDPDKVGPGVPSAQVVTHVAIPACRAAVAAHPREGRFHYQLGRALVYWADANGADTTEGIAALERAAELGHTQAIFVLGLMRKRYGEPCAVEPLYRRAAEQGLKSARISYVDEYLSGTWSGCTVGADGAAMAAYLDGAASQVSGYYENMLLGALRRGLAARVEEES